MPKLPSISPELFKAYQEEISKSSSPSTAKRKVMSLNKFFGWAKENGHIDANPLEKSKEETATAQDNIKVSKGKVGKRTWATLGLTMSLVVIIFLLLYKLKFPIPFINTPAQTAITQVTTNNAPGQIQQTPNSANSAVISAWNLFAKLKLSSVSGTPQVGTQTLTFKLYNQPAGGTPVYTSDPQSVTTDSNGSALISLDKVPTDVFFQNNQLFLEPQVGTSVMGERIPVETANTAANLQGYTPANPDTGAVPLTIPVVDQTGSLNLAGQSPAVKAKTGNLLIEGQAVTLKAADGGNGNIEINPDGNGIAHFLFEGSGQNFLNAQAPNMVSGSLFYGIVANNSSGNGYNLIKLQSGSNPTTKFSVDGNGNTYEAGNLNVAGNINTFQNIQTGGVTRLSSLGRLGSITGYYQDSGNFAIDQGTPDTATITKTATTTTGSALADVLTLKLDESALTTGSNYSTLVLKRSGGTGSNLALNVTSGNASFAGQVKLGNFSSNPGAIGAGSIIYNSTDGKVYYWNGTTWQSLSTGSNSFSGSFADLTNGTNTTAAMVIGSGASINYTGTGTVNASNFGGLSSASGTAGQFLTSGGVGTPTWTNISSALTAGTDISITGTTNATIADTSTLNSVTTRGATTTNAVSVGNLTSTGTTTFGGLTYTWPGTQTSNYVLQTNGTGTLTWANPATLGTNYWTLATGAVYPQNNTVDVLFGGDATGSAKFAFTGVDGGTPTASVSGTYLTSTGNLATTNMQHLTLGGATTGQVDVNNNLNLAAGNSYEINGTSVLNSTTLGSGVTTSSLTTVGALASGSIASGFGSITTTNGITGGTLTSSGTTTFGGITYTWPGTQTSNYVLSTNGSGTLSWTDPNSLVAATQYWNQALGAVFPKNNSVDLLVGSSATTSAKFAVTGVNGGLPTATIAGNIANVATYLTGDGNLAVTNMAHVTIGGTSTGGVDFNSPITSGTWNGSAIAAIYGGTGNTSYTTGDLLYANSATTLAKLNDVATGNVLKSGGVGVAPAWGKVALGTDTTGNYVSTVTGTANQITASASTGDITLSIPTDFRAPGTVNATTSVNTGAGAGTQRIDATGNLLNIGTTQINGITYTWPGAQSANYVLSTNGSGTLSWSDPNSLIAATQYWNEALGAVFPKNNSVDLLVGSSSTASAKFAVTGVNGGLPTATIAGNVANVAAYLTGDGNLATTNMQDLTLGGSTTGQVILNSRGSAALTANGANLTTSGTVTLPNTNTLTGVANYVQASAGYSVGGGTTYYFNGSGNINANAETLTSTLTLPNTNTLTGLTNFVQFNNGVEVGGGSTYYFDKTGNVNANNVTGAVLNATTSVNTGAGAGTARIDASGNLTNIGTTQFNGLTYTWPGTQTSNYVLSTNGSGTLSWTDPNSLVAGTQYWNQSLGAVFPKNNSVDLLVGSNATTSAKFAVTGVNGGLPTATIAGNVANVAAYLTGDGNLAVTNMANLTLGGATTGQVIASSPFSAGSITDTGLTASKGIFTDANKQLTSTGTLGADQGGTGQSSYTIGDLLYASGATALSKLADVATGNVLISGGVGTAPSWGKVVLGTHTTGNYVSTITGTANQITASAATGDVILSVPSDFRAPGTVNATTSVNTGAGAGTARIDASGNLTNIGTTQINGQTYTWPASGGSSGYALTTNGAGTLSWSPASGLGTNYWTLALGSVYPQNNTVDLLVGGSATTSAKFAFTGVDGGLPTASVAGNVANVATYLTGNGNLATTNMNHLTLGGSTTGQVDVNNSLNLSTGNGFLINNTSVLNATTLGSGVTGSSLTSVGALASGSIASGFGSITTTNGITGGTLTSSGTTTFGGITYTWPGTQTSNYVLSTNGSGTLSWTDPNSLVAATQYWNQALGAVFPKNNSVDLLVGSSATTSAKFAVTGVNGGLPTATIAGNIANVATYITGNGNLATTNMADLTVGGSTTGQVILNSRGSNSLIANGANLTAAGTITLPNSNTLTGVTNYLQASSGYSVGNGTTYYFNGSGTINANAETLASTLTLPNTNTLTGLTNFVQFNNGVQVGGGSTYYFDKTGNINANNVTGAILNATTSVNTGAGAGTARIDATGNLTNIGTTQFNGLTYTWPGTQTNNYILQTNGTGTLSWVDPSTVTSSTQYWNQALGAVFPKNNSVDLLVGSNATTSAKFAFTGVNSGTPTASIAGTLANTAIFIDGNGNISSTNRNNLTLGNSSTYNSTGNILLNPNGTGNVGIGTTSPTTVLDVAGSASISGTLAFRAGTGTIQTTAFNPLLIGGNTTGNITLNPSNGIAGGFLAPNTTNVTDLGTTSLLFRNIYATNFYQGVANNTVCDASGNCNGTAGGTKWKLANGAISPISDTLDVLIGNSATTSAKFAFTGVNTGLPTASIAGNIANVAAFLTGNGNLGTTNMQPLTIGSSTTGSVQLNPKGSTGLFVNGSGNVGIGNTAPSQLLGVGASNQLTVDASGNLVTAGYVAATGVGQFGGTTTAAYSRFGTVATTHGLSAAQDVLISGSEELNGVLYLNGRTIANQNGTATVILAATPNGLDNYNVLNNGSWLVNNNTNPGIAALMVNQNYNNPIFTASASGVTKFTIDGQGQVGIGTTPGKTLDVAGDIRLTGKFFDSNVTAGISLGDTTSTSLVGFGASSLVGALNELKNSNVEVSHNDYVDWAAAYTAKAEGTLTNPNMAPQGLFFDTFSDTTKMDSVNSTSSGAIQESNPSSYSAKPAAPFRVGLMGGQTMSTSTTDNAGNTYLGSNTVNKVFYYDRTRDSSPQVQVELGIDPNWYNGVTLSVATTSAQLSQNDTVPKPNPNLSTSYNGSLIKVTGTYASNAKTIYITIKSPTTFDWTDYNGNSATGVTITPGVAQSLGGTGVSAAFTQTSYNVGDVFKVASWFVEPSSATRGSRQQFPERSNIVGSGTGAGSWVDIIDADTQKLWMRFQTGGTTVSWSNGFMIGGNGAGNVGIVSSVSALNGEVYLSKGTNSVWSGLGTIFFANDRGSLRYDSTAGTGGYFRGNIAQRNTDLGFDGNNQTPLVTGAYGNDVAAAVIPNQPTQTVTVSGWGYIAGNSTAAISETVNLPYKFNSIPNIGVVLAGSPPSTAAPTSLGDCTTSRATTAQGISVDSSAVTTNNFVVGMGRTVGTFSSTAFTCYTWTATGTVSPKQFVAVATGATGADGGTTIINETDGTKADVSVGSQLANILWENKVAFAGNTLYIGGSDGTGNQTYLATYYNVHGLQSETSWAQYRSGWYPVGYQASPWGTNGLSISASATGTNQINSLVATLGTSTIDGTSNTLYIGTGTGLTVLQEKQGGANAGDGAVEAGGSVKYYTKDYISEEMVGDIRGMWPLSANGALSLTDASIKGDTLTNNGTVTAVSGVRGMAASFNGTNQYLSCTDAACGGTSKLDDGSNPWSVGAWIKPSATPSTYGIIISKFAFNSQYSYALYTTSTNTMKFIVSNNGSATTSVTSNSIAPNSVWTYVNGVYDGSNLKIYVNGVLENSVAYSSGIFDSTAPFGIGADFEGTSTTPANYFPGSIDEPFVTATALSAGQIKHMYEVGARALQSHATTLGGPGADQNQQLGFTSTGTSSIGDAKPDYNNQFMYVGTNSTTLGAVSKIDLNSDTNIKTYTSSANVPTGGTTLIATDTNTLAVGYNLEAAGSAASGVKSMSPDNNSNNLTGSLFSKTQTLNSSTKFAYLWTSFVTDSNDASNGINVYACNAYSTKALCDSNNAWVLGSIVYTDSSQTPSEREYTFSFPTAGSNLTFKFDFARGSTKTNTYIARYGTTWASSVGGADIAERYQSTEPVFPGDILSIASPVSSGTASVSKSRSQNDQKIIGVVTTNPGIVMDNNLVDLNFNAASRNSPDRPAVALAGRVPVNVSTKNGPILVGDPLTSSEIAGFAVKSTHVGNIVAKALDKFDCTSVNATQMPDGTCQGQVLALINVSWFDPSIYLTDTGNLHITATQSASVASAAGTTNIVYQIVRVLTNGTQEVVDQIGTFGKVVAANIEIGAANIQNLVSPKINVALISPIPGDTNITVQIGSTATPSGQFAIQNASGSAVATIDNVGNATFSGELYAANIHGQNIDDIQNLLKKVQADQNILLAATSSADLNATNSANLSNLVASDLYITNQAAINSLSISNSITLGSDFVLGQGTINSLTAPLKIQSLAMAPVEIMNGLVTIDTKGNVNIAGNLNLGGNLTANGRVKASGLTLQGYTLQGNATDSASLLTLQNASGIDVAKVDASGSANFSSIATNGLVVAAPDATVAAQLVNGVITTNSTVGSATIPAGTSEITIRNPKVTDYTLVYVTPTGSTQNNVLYIKSKQAGQFIVGFDQPLSASVNFNWWIVQVGQ